MWRDVLACLCGAGISALSVGEITRDLQEIEQTFVEVRSRGRAARIGATSSATDHVIPACVVLLGDVGLLLCRRRTPTTA